MTKKQTTIRQAVRVATEATAKLSEAVNSLNRALAIIEAKDVDIARLERELFDARAAIVAVENLRTLKCSDLVQ